MIGQPSKAKIAQEPRLYGVIDVIRRDRIAGWVIDRTDAARCAEVDIHREGRLVGTARADRLRKDLMTSGVGTGAYGFSFVINPPLGEGMEFTVSVTARSHDGVCVPLELAAGAARSVSAERKALGRILAEVVNLRCEIEAARSDVQAIEAARASMFERIELVQLRLEGAIGSAEQPKVEAAGWLRWVRGAGASIAIICLLAGVYSLS